MKHFRRLEQAAIVETLERVTGVTLEDPRLSGLYELLVNKGDYIQVENFITNAISSKFSNKVRSKLTFSFHFGF